MRHAKSRATARGRPAAWTEDRGLSERCITFGLPNLLAGYNSYYQIFQTDDHVVIQQELIHTTRVIPLDDRPHVRDEIRQWHGDARGHWEGATLVVETSNFNSGKRWRSVGAGAQTDPEGLDSVVGVYDSTKSLTLVERFTRVDAATLEYEYTVTDPETWTRPWTAVQSLRKNPEPLFEYACHEGNYAAANMLAGARQDEAAAAGR